MHDERGLLIDFVRDGFSHARPLKGSADFLIWTLPAKGEGFKPLHLQGKEKEEDEEEEEGAEVEVPWRGYKA